MDADLAFCLEQFVEEQVLENYEETKTDLEQLQEKEAHLTHRLNDEESRDCRSEMEIVEEFCRDLRLNEEKIVKAREQIERLLQSTLEEILTSIDALDTKAGTSKDSHDRIQRTKARIAEERKDMANLTIQLIRRIDETNENTCHACVLHWFEQHLEYTEQIYCGGDSRKKSRLPPSMDRLVEFSIRRVKYWAERYRIISHFLQKLQLTYTELRDDLVDAYLKRIEYVGPLVELIHSFVKDRQTQRRTQLENLLEDQRSSIEAMFQEQRTHAIALRRMVRQLAVGSSLESHFNQQFNEVVNELDKHTTLIVGKLNDSTAEELPLTLRFDADFHTWSVNEFSIQEEFCASLANALELPVNSIHVVKVEQGSTILKMLIQAPHGKQVADALSCEPERSNLRREKTQYIHRIQHCLSKFKARLYSIAIGDLGLKTDEAVMDPRWNRIYDLPNTNLNTTYWSNSIDRGGHPYFCPIGWKRFGIKVARNGEEFDIKWGSWPVAYHGTRGKYAPHILATGLHTSTRGCYIPPPQRRVYLSPSIEYAAHSRYARPWQRKNDKNRWYQLVFQCRVRPQSATKQCPETLIKESYKSTVIVDPNFSNDELEWVIPAESANEVYIRQNIICYGMMVRVSDCDPKDLPTSTWWKYSRVRNDHYDSVS